MKKYKLVIVQIENNDIQKFKEFFDELIAENGNIEGNLIVYKVENEFDISLQEISQTIKDDFGFKISIFESNYIDDSKYCDYIALYNQIKKDDYDNVSSLIRKIKNIDNLKLISNIILDSINNDIELINVCKAMFKNNLNVSKASIDVFMHRNTVINKLDYIYKNTSLNIQVFNDAIAMYLVINNR